MKALVFHARGYEFASRTTGELIVGNTVSYLEVMDSFQEEREKGLPPMTVSATDECLANILRSSLPAVCDIELGRRPGAKGKPETVMTAFKPGKAWKIEEILQGPASPAK